MRVGDNVLIVLLSCSAGLTLLLTGVCGVLLLLVNGWVTVPGLAAAAPWVLTGLVVLGWTVYAVWEVRNRAP